MDFFNQKLEPMAHALVGSYADTLMKQGRIEGIEEGIVKGMEKGAEIAENLHSIKMLCKLFKKIPEYTDKEITNLVECSAKMTKELRQLLDKTAKNKAGQAVQKKYFKDLELTTKQQKELFKFVAKYYEKDKAK